MKANYHTHSKWCHHGDGEIEDYIKEALKNNFVELAITDHVCHVDRFSWLRPEEFSDFDKDLNRCVEEYQDRIKVIKGFECEYIPAVMDQYKRYREEYGYELFILGQHVAGDDGEYNMFGPKDSDVIKRYCQDVITGLQTGFFAYLAHPDVCLIEYAPGWDKVCEQGFKDIFKTCEELRIPVEFNCNGYRYKKEYPNSECWKLAKEYDLKYMIGSDAHSPELLYDNSVKEAEELLKTWGIPVTELLT